MVEKDGVLLVYPKLGDSEVEVPNIPLNLVCIGSYLEKKGVEVRIVDAHNWSDSEFYNKIKRYLEKSLLVGITAKTAQIPHALRIAEFIRGVDEDVKIIWGGKHPSLFPEQTAENRYVDVVVRKEGEETLYELFKSLKNNLPIKSIKGITYQKNGRIYSTEERNPLDLDELPPLNFKLLEYVKENPNISKIAKEKRNGMPVITSRGCPHRCTFCINTALKEKFRCRSADLILKDFQIYAEQGINKLFIVDECFFANRETIKILKGMADLKLQWHTTLRVDYFRENFVNKEVLNLVKKSGCVMLAVGAESGSQKILDMLKKDIKVEDIIRSAQMLAKAEIPANYSFMIGLPNETEEDIYKTLKLIVKISEIYPKIEIYGPQIYRPYPGSELYESVRDMLDFPKTLEEWEDTRLLFGERSNFPCNYPWLTLPEGEIKKLRFYGSNANGFVQQYQGKYGLLERTMKKIIRWRINRSFYSIPIDYWLYQRVYDVTSYLRYKKIKEGKQKTKTVG